MSGIGNLTRAGIALSVGIAVAAMPLDTIRLVGAARITVTYP